MGNKAIKLKDKNNNTFYPCPYYPIGSIYMNVNNVNPNEYFGGEWEQIKDVFLLCAGDKYEAGSTGGEAEHTLTENEMPSHTHPYAIGANLNAAGWRLQVGYIGSVSNGDGSGAIGTTGGNQPHNNMPPYIAIYVWQRIA